MVGFLEAYSVTTANLQCHKSSRKEELKMIDLNGIDLTAVLDEVTGMLPVVLPAVIGFIAFRKGFSFLKNTLKGV